MKKFITLILILLSLISFGQGPILDDLWKLYQSHDYDKVIENAKSHLNTDSLKADLNLLLGRSYADKGEFNKAIPYLKFTADNEFDYSWRKAWALGYLGTCYFMLQDYKNSENSILECLNLKSTKNVTKYAYKRYLFFGFVDYYSNWKIIESNNFRFHFQNMNESGIKNYIASHELAFNEINNFFKSYLPKKIDFFVWDSNEDAKKLLRAELGFSDPEMCIVHSHFQQTIGHEMTHVISHYSTKIVKKTELINVGTSVCFDQSNIKRAHIVKEWVKLHDKKITIKDIWINWKSYPEELTYPLSGLFVKELINNFGREKFIEFFSNQTFDNAKLVFGDNINKVIKEFEDRINI
ncbi:MAG: hypothetical protein WBB02_15240 [Saprospiraceae bacterium]